MTADKRRFLLKGKPLAGPPHDLVGLVAQGAEIIVGPGAFDELSDAASEDGLTIAVKDPVALALPATAMRWASLSYKRAMAGPKGRQANADELQLWQDVAAEAGLGSGGSPQAMMFWVESIPGMTVLVVWPEGSGAHSSEVANVACRIEAACRARLGGAAIAIPPRPSTVGSARADGAWPPPGASPGKGLGGVFGWLVLLAMFGAAAYFIWGMG